MKRLGVIVLLLCCSVFTSAQGLAPFPGGLKGGGGFQAGFDFRATSGFVTDNAPNTYVLATDTYPTFRGGFTFGWETTTGLDSRDRNAGVNPRLAGMNFKINNDTNTSTFRVDLPSTGTYTIRLALGDGTAANASTNYIVVKDGTTSVITFAPVTSTGGWVDAVGTEYTVANWLTSNTAVSKTFATTILRVVMGGTNSGGDATGIGYLGINL